MIYMGTAGDRGGGWPRWTRRIAAVPDVPHALAVVGSLLALAAMTEAIARGAATGMSVAELVGVGAHAASTTVPLAFLGPVAAAVAICAANALSVAAFGTLTVAGLAAVLIVLYRLGCSRTAGPWDAAQLLAPALDLPFLVLALTGTGGSPGRDRPAGTQRGAGTQRRPAGRRGNPARAHGSGGTSAHRPRTARRGSASHIDDRRPGGDGAAGHPGHARGGCAAAAADR